MGTGFARGRSSADVNWTGQRPPAAVMDEADLRIVPDDFHELGMAIGELRGETPTHDISGLQDR